MSAHMFNFDEGGMLRASVNIRQPAGDTHTVPCLPASRAVTHVLGIQEVNIPEQLLVLCSQTALGQFFPFTMQDLC